jgi:hypothetical protein
MEGKHMKRNLLRVFLTAVALSAGSNAVPAKLEPGPTDGRPRVIVTSGGEIDDECSMVRFLLYANEWDGEAIVTSSSQYHWHEHKWAGDAIALRRTHHLWVDHCDLSACGDGLLDITNQSDYVAVSWTRFSKHHKTMLINSGTSQPEDMGHLNTTIHHCWFNGSDTRNPRAGYGKVHVFNCLYNGNDYGIGNIFQDCKGQRAIEGISFPMQEYYRYKFALNAAADGPEIVKAGAGLAEAFGKVTPLPVPGNGSVAINLKPKLWWSCAPVATISSRKF